MKKSDLHATLRTTAVPVPDHSGCWAVIPVTPKFFTVQSSLLPLARREMQVLADAVRAAPGYASLLMHMLNRREAVDSSQIEGTKTEFDALLLHEIEIGTPDATADADADLTLGYVHAYLHGAVEVEAHGSAALDTPLICTLHRELMRGDPRAAPGQLRLVQNRIGGLKIEDARFIPPPAGEVPRLMSELSTLIRNEPDPSSHYRYDILVRAPIVHAQFEAIHPFNDGNGRVGRMLLPLMLLAEGDVPIHLASFLKLRQQEYYDALLDVQMRLHWAPWMQLFLECTIASCRHTTHLLSELGKIAERWRIRLTERQLRKHATAWRLADILLGQPVVTTNAVAKLLDVSYPAANDAIKLLVEMEILRLQTKQARHRAFHAHEVMNLLYTGIDAVLQDVGTLQNYGGGKVLR